LEEEKLSQIPFLPNVNYLPSFPTNLESINSFQNICPISNNLFYNIQIPILKNVPAPYFDYPNYYFASCKDSNYLYQPFKIPIENNIPLNDIKIDSKAVEKITKENMKAPRIEKTKNVKDKKVNSHTLLWSKQKESKKNSPMNIQEAIKQYILFRNKAKNLKLAGFRNTLQLAAKELKVSKKTMDDFQMYLRTGLRLNYDFENNLNESFGIFRKKMKKFQRKDCPKVPKNEKDVELRLSHLVQIDN